MKRRVLITGANGFIGRYVAKKYSEEFHVIGLGHGKWDAEEYTQWGIDEWYCDDVTMASLCRCAKNVDVIVHCAGSGSVGFSMSNPMLDFERTVWTTHYILEYIRLYSPNTKLIYPSSAAVYGNCKQMPIKEDAVLQPISPYGVHKKIVEDLCRMYSDVYKLNIVVMRLFSVYGDGLCKQLLWDACNKIANNNNVFWGTGQESRDFIHVTDVAEAMLLACSHDQSNFKIVNLASGTSTSIQMLLSELFRSYGTDLRPCFGGEVNEGNPVHYWADITRMNNWGWKPKKDLSDGIEEYVRWYKSNA